MNDGNCHSSVQQIDQAALEPEARQILQNWRTHGMSVEHKMLYLKVYYETEISKLKEKAKEKKAKERENVADHNKLVYLYRDTCNELEKLKKANIEEQKKELDRVTEALNEKLIATEKENERLKEELFELNAKSGEKPSDVAENVVPEIKEGKMDLESTTTSASSMDESQVTSLESAPGSVKNETQQDVKAIKIKTEPGLSPQPRNFRDLSDYCAAMKGQGVPQLLSPLHSTPIVTKTERRAAESNQRCTWNLSTTENYPEVGRELILSRSNIFSRSRFSQDLDNQSSGTVFEEDRNRNGDYYIRVTVPDRTIQSMMTVPDDTGRSVVLMHFAPQRDMASTFVANHCEKKVSPNSSGSERIPSRKRQLFSPMDSKPTVPEKVSVVSPPVGPSPKPSNADCAAANGSGNSIGEGDRPTPVPPTFGRVVSMLRELNSDSGTYDRVLKSLVSELADPTMITEVIDGVIDFLGTSNYDSLKIFRDTDDSGTLFPGTERCIVTAITAPQGHKLEIFAEFLKRVLDRLFEARDLVLGQAALVRVFVGVSRLVELPDKPLKLAKFLVAREPIKAHYIMVCIAAVWPENFMSQFGPDLKRCSDKIKKDYQNRDSEEMNIFKQSLVALKKISDFMPQLGISQ